MQLQFKLPLVILRFLIANDSLCDCQRPQPCIDKLNCCHIPGFFVRSNRAFDTDDPGRILRIPDLLAARVSDDSDLKACFRSALFLNLITGSGRNALECDGLILFQHKPYLAILPVYWQSALLGFL